MERVVPEGVRLKAEVAQALARGGTTGTTGTTDDKVVSADDIADGELEERAALVEIGAGPWAEGFARLDLTRPPLGFSAKRWSRTINDGGRFLDCWGATAADLGWSPLDVFGLHPVAPGARLDAMGLAALIGGGGVRP